VRAAGGSELVAALYFGTTPDGITELAVRGLDDITLLRAIAQFRAVDQGHEAAGTWLGGLRVLPGTTVGQLLVMQVRVWDLNLFATFDDAKTMGDMPWSRRLLAIMCLTLALEIHLPLNSMTSWESLHQNVFPSRQSPF